MARESFAETQIPAAGKTDIPYPDHVAVVRKLGQHLTEAYVAQGVGAGGTGVDITGVPFSPAYMRLSEATAPLLQEQWHLSDGTVVGINSITGADAAADATVTKVGTGDYTVSLPTGVAPDGDTVTCIFYGARDVGGSL